MNTIEQIKCLGAMDDWTQVDDHRRELRYKEYRVVDGKMWTAISSQMPDWLNSYDAIIPLIKKQALSVQISMLTNLYGRIEEKWLSVEVCCLFNSTPSQLCEALLRAVGEWKD